MPDSVPVIFDNQTAPTAAQQAVLDIAQQAGLAIAAESDAILQLHIVDDCLVLNDASDAKSQGVKVDFLSGQSQYRRAHGGGSKEPIAKAIGLKQGHRISVVDATPGLGRDAFVLAALGAQVTMVERSPVVYALLADGLRRLAMQEPELASRFSLVHANSAEYMQTQPVGSADAVYLDPMFPHKKKSALVKKEMRVFQALLGPDADADALLPAAQAIALKRVVVKRPNSAPFLAQTKPSMAISSKKHRFDVYINV